MNKYRIQKETEMSRKDYFLVDEKLPTGEWIPHRSALDFVIEGPVSYEEWTPKLPFDTRYVQVAALFPNQWQYIDD